jgi:hypothetical protein
MLPTHEKNAFFFHLLTECGATRGQKPSSKSEIALATDETRILLRNDRIGPDEAQFPGGNPYGMPSLSYSDASAISTEKSAQPDQRHREK